VRELLLLAALYVAYSGTRLFADDALRPAAGRAEGLVEVERALGLAWERSANRLFVEVDLLGLVGSYWYATAHYVVTAAALVWLYRRGPAAYVPARRALLLATVLGLALYLLLPMAPPRLVDGYVDVLHLHAAAGWWGADASAPRGLGGLTNQLAAFPSLHAGWALWVALAIRRGTRSRAWRAFGWSHAMVTAVVVVGTGNHWVLDAVVGWLVVAAAWIGLDRLTPSGENSAGTVALADRPAFNRSGHHTQGELTCVSDRSSLPSAHSRSRWG
jgi:hypothetical protein